MHRKMLSISTACGMAVAYWVGTVIMTASNEADKTDSLNYQNKYGV